MSKIYRMQFLLLALLVVAASVLSPRAEAQNTGRADTVYNGWISAYQVNDGSNFYMAKSFTDRSAGFWSQGYLIVEAQDAYFQTRTASRYTQIVQLLNDFLARNGTNWGPDSWDDDLEWIIYAFVRGYEITGNTNYLNAAVNNWNLVYTRGWDSTFGGGIWEENTGRQSKCVLSNAPFVIEGVELYRMTGDANYLTKSEQVYDWERTHLYNYTNSNNSFGAPGQADECVHSSGVTVSNNIYNMGLIVNAANSLYRATLNSQYLGDAQLTAKYVMSKWPILNADYPQNGYFSADHLIRGMAAMATQNNLWNTYNTYLQNNADAAWKERRTDYNISNNIWTSPTGTGNVYAMETGASVTIQVSLPTQYDVLVNFPRFTLQNAQNGLVLDVTGGSTSSGAAVVQSPYVSGSTHQLWSFVPTAGGYYQIKNVNSGLVLNVKGHSISNGALVQQYAAQGMQPGNDQWLPAVNPDGTFSFYNLNSNKALDMPGGSSTSGAQFDQAFANNSLQQRFTLSTH